MLSDIFQGVLIGRAVLDPTQIGKFSRVNSISSAAPETSRGGSISSMRS